MLPKLFELPLDTDPRATSGLGTSGLSLSTLEALKRSIEQKIEQLKAAQKSTDSQGPADASDGGKKD